MFILNILPSLLNLELYYNVEAWFDYAKHKKDFKKYFDEFGTSQDYPFRDYLRVFFKDNHALDYVIDRINKACGFPKIELFTRTIEGSILINLHKTPIPQTSLSYSA